MSTFRPVEREIDFQKSENEWMQFWNEKDIFGKQLAQGRERAVTEHPENPTYVFFEGPPTANGIPHPGHVLTRVIKDLFPRFRAMQGYDVPRKAGWDTHGLPVEVSVEKELGIEGKQGIEDFGVEPFIKKCKDSVFKYSDLWAKLTARIGFWIDLNDPYVTYHQSYINSVWWSLKQIFDAGLIYHGHKIVPWCPRCGTALSSQEVGQGYKNVADPSAYVAFRSKDDPKLLFLAWTTTPWTLLSNVALAVGKDFDYDYVQMGDETLVMASALREKVLGKVAHTVTKTVKGADLLGKEYEQLFTFATVDKPAFRVISGDFVGLDTGSGIVHIAPAYGEDDNLVGKQNDLPSINLVNTDGTFMDCVSPWKGIFVKEADKQILRELKERKQLFKTEQYLHDYPYCWRCDSPLLYYPRPAWYIRTTEIKEEMLKNNAAINWLPEHIQDGRFGNFLATNVDWALSRERYWGTPLPIWRCHAEGCGHSIAIGGEAELLAKAVNKADFPDGVELHKPYVDQVVIACEKCGGMMQRVPEVIDCWYDSGAMHFAQWGYPYAPESDKKLAAALPADFISEAIDQTRGWFYTLLAIASLLKESAKRQTAAGTPVPELQPWAEKPYPLPYRNCLVLGHVCDGDGYKMSKSKGNYLDPWEILNREGADAMRWYFYSSNQPWTSVRFVAEAIRDAQKDFLVRLRNVYSFFVIYANIDGFNPAAGAAPTTLDAEAFTQAASFIPPARRSQLDLWMLSKLESATAEVTANLEGMNILAAAQSLSALVEGLSNWFVRRSRDRFWQAEKNETKWSAYWTLYESLARVATLAAPFVPFMAEELYQRCFKELLPTLPESVHLLAWPQPCPERRNIEVENKMDLVREIASLGLSARASFKLKVRQPLSKAVVILTDHEMRAQVAELADVIRDELNVHEVEFADDAAQYVQYQIKPDFKKLGPKLGKNVKACAAELAQANAAELVAGLAADGAIGVEIEGKSYELLADELDVRIDAKEGFAAASGRGAVVAIDSTLTPELEREGLARELVNRIQGLRKELDLPYEARIKLRIGAGGSVARAALEHEKFIAAETLASDIRVEFEPLQEVREFVIADEQVRIALQAL